MLISYKSESSGLRYSYLVPNNIINDRLMDCIGMLVLFIAVGSNCGCGAELLYIQEECNTDQ